MSEQGERARPSTIAEVLETDEAKGLLEAGREAGTLNTEEIALALGELELDAAQIDDFYHALEEQQIEVVDGRSEEGPASGALAGVGSKRWLDLMALRARQRVYGLPREDLRVDSEHRPGVWPDDVSADTIRSPAQVSGVRWRNSSMVRTKMNPKTQRAHVRVTA